MRWAAVLGLIAILSVEAEAGGIVVHAPQGGTYARNEQCKVRWTARDVTGSVEIQLVGQGKTRHRRYLRRVPATDAELVFRIPERTPPGRYVVRVVQGGVMGKSRVFRVVEADEAASRPPEAGPVRLAADYGIQDVVPADRRGQPLSMTGPALYTLGYDGSRSVPFKVRTTVVWNGAQPAGVSDCQVRLESSYTLPPATRVLGQRSYAVTAFDASRHALVEIPMAIPADLRVGQRVRVTLRLRHARGCDSDSQNNVRNLVLSLEGGPGGGVDLRCEIRDVRYRHNPFSHSHGHKISFVVGGFAEGATHPIRDVAFTYKVEWRPTDVENARWLEPGGQNLRGLVNFPQLDGTRRWDSGPHDTFIYRTVWRNIRERDPEFRITVTMDPNGSVRDANPRNNVRSTRFRIP